MKKVKNILFTFLYLFPFILIFVLLFRNNAATMEEVKQICSNFEITTISEVLQNAFNNFINDNNIFIIKIFSYFIFITFMNLVIDLFILIINTFATMIKGGEMNGERLSNRKTQTRK